MREQQSHKVLLEGYLNSYTQVFFSTNRIFAVILVIVTFFNLIAGLSGLIAITVSNLMAYFAGFKRTYIRNGFYGFNSLLVSLGLGIFYQPGLEYFTVLILASILTLFFTVLMEGVIGKYGLPYMSVPFLLGIWFVTLAARTYDRLELSEAGVYALNEMYLLGGLLMVQAYEWFGNLELPASLVTYFRSLGAIFFQYHLFPGILIAIGLLIYSRVAFQLSLLGFFTAWAFYQVMGADMNELNYAYIGFNFILTAIAIGGYFIIPSIYSYLWVVILTPLIAIVLTATNSLFYIYQLPVYSLPFNIIVLIFLYILKFRQKHLDKPALILIQHHSPEKNLYYYRSYEQRFGKRQDRAVSLPFYGSWSVTQGHGGEITHKDRWQYAWDFEIRDEKGKTYKNSGDKPEDYYCFNKPVIAPADGYIEKVQDGIEDNAIGEVNLKRNWGNAVVIRHGEKFYSLLCHLKKDSIGVKPGEFVKKGSTIGLCGNSGRSPYPHLHFQLQETPQIGSGTLKHPLSIYIKENDKKPELINTGIPSQGDVVHNIEVDPGLRKAFNFVPGEKLTLAGSDQDKDKPTEWEVKTDIYNNAFIECLSSGARAYFQLNDEIFYFTSYKGPKDTLLYRFYLAAYRVIFGYYRNLEIKDFFPLHLFSTSGERFLQDIVSPFYLFLKSEYSATYLKESGSFDENSYEITSVSKNTRLGKDTREWKARLKVDKGSIQTLTIFERGTSKEIQLCERS